MVFDFLLGHKARPAGPLYDQLMLASRHAMFYAELDVADSVEGRLEMLMIHVGLVVDRLSDTPDGNVLSRALSERFVDDMQRSLRELGYDDSGLKRRLKAVVRAFYGRMAALRTALASPDAGALDAVIVRNVYAGGGDAAKAARLADHVRQLARRLAATSVDDLAAGRLPPVAPSLHATGA